MKPFQLEFLPRRPSLVPAIALLAANAMAAAYVVLGVQAWTAAQQLDQSSVRSQKSAHADGRGHGHWRREGVNLPLVVSHSPLQSAFAALEVLSAQGARVQTVSYAAAQSKLRATVVVDGVSDVSNVLSQLTGGESRWTLDEMRGREADVLQPLLPRPPQGLPPLQITATGPGKPADVSLGFSWVEGSGAAK